MAFVKKNCGSTTQFRLNSTMLDFLVAPFENGRP